MPYTYAERPTLTCPACNHPFPAEVWLIVDTTERPDLLPHLQAGTLHALPCPACTHTIELDAPLLLYRPAAEPRLLFSPAQQTSAEQDQQHAVGLLSRLQESLGDDWRNEWLAEGLPGIPRPLLPTMLDGGNPQAAMEQMMAQTAEAIERLRRDNPEAYAQLEEATRQAMEAADSDPTLQLDVDTAEKQALADKLVAWIQQETLDEAETYLHQHETELLTDDAAAVMQLLVEANPDNSSVRDHQQRLARAHQVGITAMYAEIRQQRQQERIEELQQQLSPIHAAITRFIQIEDDDSAAALLQSETSLLLTTDAGDILRQFSEAAASAGDDSLSARLRTRHQLWQTAYHARAGNPLRPAPVEVQTNQPESWTDHADRQAVHADRGSQYTVITARNCAIGDNALVINNIGVLPLRWQRPAEGRPVLARTAVGRETELAELHQRLLAGQNAALVSRGTSAALRGQPAIGKTTLAAMYVDRYGNNYPGGVLWLEVGPDRRTADRVTPILQRMTTFAYAADPQATALLDNTEFAPEVVKALLHGHGALLVVIDDAWDPAALKPLQTALPDDAFVILTTRDYHVAYALENTEAAIQPLDVLTPADARQLLQKGAPGLPADLAGRVAAGLGCHAQALTLAAGALAFRKAHRYLPTAEDLLHRVAVGQGFGDLPRLDHTDRLTPVEIALKYSYDELNAPQQARFRALGVFAPEADFDGRAAAALWQLDFAPAEAFLLLLYGLGLIRETGEGGRWQMHAILRAYTLSLQTAAERVDYPERHADYYLALAQTCYNSTPRRYDQVEREFAQLQHLFPWCAANSPRRVTRLTFYLDDFMRNRGRIAQLNRWLQAAMQGAEIHGDRLGKANTLSSLGNLERRLGNVAQARGHYEAALPLYEAEQARLGKANTLISLGDLESRLGNVAQARGHYEAALPLYEAEQDPTGKMNTWISLARLETALEHLPEADRYYQQVFTLAEQIGFADHPVVQGWRQEYAGLGQTVQLPPDKPNPQHLADLLINWIKTPDWAQSEAYLQTSAAELLTDEAEAVLALLQSGNPDNRAIPQHLILLARCRSQGIAAGYQELRSVLAEGEPATQNPTALALAALLQVNSMESFQAVLAQHPVLLQLPTLTELAGMFAAAHQAGQPDAAQHLLARLAILLEQYNHTHAEQVDPAEQAQFVALHQALLPLAETLEADLAAQLRQSLGWALNTLGNTYSEQGNHAAAITAYSQAIGYTPENAMFYRNRAGEYLELKQWAQAETDIDQAAALEPDAPRLSNLRQALAQQSAE